MRNLMKTAAVAAFALSAVPALALPITVVNHSFETLPAGGLPLPFPLGSCGLGCSFSLDAIPGWVNNNNDGNTGQFQPGTHAGNFTFFSSLSDGITSAYSNGSAITQTVGVTVVPGVVYTLLVDIGDKNIAPALGTPQLRVNSVLYSGTGTLVPGGWATFTASYTGLAVDAGLAIEIVLSSGGDQGNFDNVRLSDNPQLPQNTGPSNVPEPITLSLLGAGLLGIGAMRRRLRA